MTAAIKKLWNKKMFWGLSVISVSSHDSSVYDEFGYEPWLMLSEYDLSRRWIFYFFYLVQCVRISFIRSSEFNTDGLTVWILAKSNQNINHDIMYAIYLTPLTNFWLSWSWHVINLIIINTTGSEFLLGVSKVFTSIELYKSHSLRS